MEFYLFFCYTAIWDQTSWEIFCSMMLIWFSMLGILGNSNCATSRSFKAINPYYAYQLLRIHPDGFFVLGFVFCVQLEQKRCILTWDIAVENIRISWIFCKTALI
jgi:KUP system potassium uptake protein